MGSTRQVMQRQGSAGCARAKKRLRPTACARTQMRARLAPPVCHHPGGGDPSDAGQEGQDDREADEDTTTKAVTRVDGTAATGAATVAMAAMAADRTAADSMGEGRGDDRGDGGGRFSLPHEARAWSATIRRVRADARQSRWADITQTGGRGREFTCHWPRLGRVEHVGRRKMSLPARALSTKMMWAPPCLRTGILAAVRRAQCRVR